MTSLHQLRTHPEFVEGCFACKVGSLQFATAPTNDTQARQHDFQTRFAAEFHNGDREAYRRLRRDGLQPPRIAGSAHLEKHASTRFEVESGAVTDNAKGLKAALAMCADGGMDPLKAVTTPAPPTEG